MRDNKTNRKNRTEEVVGNELDRMFLMAAKEKLLPQIIHDYSIQNHNPKLLQMYR
jgi:hypothetical protein